MKSKYKYFVSAALSGLFGLLVAFSANAQHRGGGGGGGFHGGGGGSHGSFGGGGGFHGSSGGGFHGNAGGGSTFRGNTGGSHVVAGARSNYSFQGGVRASVGARGYSGVAPRGGVAARGYYNRGIGPATAYRGGVYRGGYNRFYGHYAYYNQFYLPRIGLRIGYLPYGYYPFYWGDYQYFYSDGYYYQYDNNNYTVVEPPIGAILNQLPAGAKSLLIDGQQYYELNGVYYQAVTKDDGSTGYQIAGKDGQLTTAAGDPNVANADQGQSQPASALKIGDIVNNLPADCNTVKIDGQKYYVAPDGYYYQETKDNSNRKVYRVAGTPTDEPTN